MQTVFHDTVSFIEQYVTIPNISGTDIVEITIIAIMLYELMIWIKNTRAWMLLKGIIILLSFVLLATVFNLTTILWIADKTFNVGVIAAIIVFQPELRKALEQLGRKNIINSIFTFDDTKNINEKFSDHTINEIIKAVYELAKHKTGALIVIENEMRLSEYERTGIEIDARISNQLLINIFEHNTPLHDGAIIIRGNRVVSATCYLPLSDNMELSKELGTRHRAGVGVSEATDSTTIIVSEETGKVSVAKGGILLRNLDGDQLKSELIILQNKSNESKRFKLWKGRRHNEKGVDE